ncbi:MAG: hypothetical protein V4532_09580 [Pseudomonadota bacterium]
MIVRIEIDGTRAGFFEYRVSYESEELYADAGLESMLDCLVAAVEGMAPDVSVAEVWYRGVVSGTYPLQVIAANLDQIEEHAVNTTTSVEEALGGERE